LWAPVLALSSCSIQHNIIPRFFSSLFFISSFLSLFVSSQKMKTIFSCPQDDPSFAHILCNTLENLMQVAKAFFLT
jgi:hypothetical protein